MGLWDRFVEWDRRVSRRLGLRSDDPEKSPEENIRLAQSRRRYWLRPPIVVDDDELIAPDDAKAALRGRWGSGPNIGLLVARGLLQPCFTRNARQGVTRSSVDAEMQWRLTASPWRRFTRGLGGILHWL
jgi:hypothetical protein